MATTLRGRLGSLTALLMLTCALTACGSTPAAKPADDATTPASRPASPSPSATSVPVDPAVAMKQPGPLDKPLLSADVLVFSKDTLSPSVVRQIGKLTGVVHTELFSMGQFFSEEKSVTYAAVDPDTFRRLTPVGTAQSTAVWDRVAGGELAIEPTLGKALQDSNGAVTLGNESDSPDVHIGAYAPIVAPELNPAVRIDAVVNQRWAERLHMKPDNAMIFSMGSRSPQSIQKQLLKITGTTASVQILGVNIDTKIAQTVVLTGGSIAEAIGSFTYTLSGNTVIPQASWVDRMITTETLPVVGTVRCNRVMLKQLSQVMLEIQREGLAKLIHQYGGCYVPRYIAGTHQLSFHTFGTAIDLNVADNQRGTRGKMDPRIVSIFKQWGFNWGGDWHYTDPMHFELARLVRTP